MGPVAALGAIGLLMFGFLMVLETDSHRAKMDASCTADGGHFVHQPFSPDECWLPDGTRRLFPEGF